MVINQKAIVTTKLTQLIRSNFHYTLSEIVNFKQYLAIPSAVRSSAEGNSKYVSVKLYSNRIYRYPLATHHQEFETYYVNDGINQQCNANICVSYILVKSQYMIPR